MILRTRFAPSPTGDLHLGGAWTALASWVLARRAGGSCVLRVEDLNRPRIVAGAQDRIEDDLRWLGLDFDEGPVAQSSRGELYQQALASLAGAGLVYPCDCSRAEIARVASAPHEGDDVVYPGHCRERDPSRSMRRPASLRIRVPSRVVTYCDLVLGNVTQDLARSVGDFVLRRADGVFSYQLAVVVDDLAMGITDVVRGADLVSSTPRQIWLAHMLGAVPPRYGHVPLVVGERGARLEKRTPRAIVRQLREAGVAAPRIVGELAHGLGLAPTNAPATPHEIVRGCTGRDLAWRREPWMIPESIRSGS